MGHSDIAVVLLALAVILAGAKLGGDMATRAGQPAVLGELVAGVLLGNLHLLGVPWFRAIASNPSVDVLAQLGVLILLFGVGLESTVRDMLKVGLPSLLVAVLGLGMVGLHLATPVWAILSGRRWVAADKRSPPVAPIGQSRG